MAESDRDARILDSDFRIGTWEVRPPLNRKRASELTVQLEPKHMDVLVYLSQQEGEVRDKNEIIAAVWPQQFVADSVLTRAIAELR